MNIDMGYSYFASNLASCIDHPCRIALVQIDKAGVSPKTFYTEYSRFMRDNGDLVDSLAALSLSGYRISDMKRDGWCNSSSGQWFMIELTVVPCSVDETNISTEVIELFNKLVVVPMD